MQTFIESMPKAELHVHLEGTLDAELSLALTRKYHLSPNLDLVAPANGGLAAAKTAAANLELLRDELDFYQLAIAYLIKAKTQNIVYVELVFNPQLHSLRGIDLGTAVRGIRRAQLIGARQLGIKSGLLMGLDASLSAESALLHLVMAEPYREWIQGLSLKGAPTYSITKFKQLMLRAKAMGFKTCLELQDEFLTKDHLKPWLQDIKPERLTLNSALVDWSLAELANSQPLTLGYLPAPEQGLDQLLALGQPVSLHSGQLGQEQPIYTRTLRAAQTHYQLTAEALAELVANTFDSAWMPDVEKLAYQAMLETYLAESAGIYRARAAS